MQDLTTPRISLTENSTILQYTLEFFKLHTKLLVGRRRRSLVLRRNAQSFLLESRPCFEMSTTAPPITESIEHNVGSTPMLKLDQAPKGNSVMKRER